MNEDIRRINIIIVIIIVVIIVIIISGTFMCANEFCLSNFITGREIISHILWSMQLSKTVLLLRSLSIATHEHPHSFVQLGGNRIDGR